MALSVIGAGFGRTGTLSLKHALEMLGLGPCYHMMEVWKRPEDVAQWQRAADGASVDWDRLFDGYRAAVDWPTCRYYGDLAERYPQAKVILTLRDPGRWYDSAWNTIFRMMLEDPPATDPARLARRRMARQTIIEQTFEGRIDDRDHAIAIFERHVDEVKKAIPAERLLVYQAGEGWDPLCDFLGVPVPEEPYPKVNTTDDFKKMVAERTAAEE